MTTEATKKIDAQVANTVRARRIQAGLTQTQVAELIGKTFQQVQKYETGFNRMSAGVLATLAPAFGCQVSDFFEPTEPVHTTRRASPEALELAAVFDSAPAQVRAAIIKVVRSLAAESSQ